MQEKQLFEYAVIRVVPRVEREEFLNVGIVVYCAKQKFLQSHMERGEERLRAFCPHCDIAEIMEYLNSFQKICEGGADGGPIGRLTVAERFRWLTAVRSTVVQSSKVHSGLSEDLSGTVNKLFAQLVFSGQVPGS
jgi:hypothetical protein